jgi:hypothetical protein
MMKLKRDVNLTISSVPRTATSRITIEAPLIDPPNPPTAHVPTGRYAHLHKFIPWRAQ